MPENEQKPRIYLDNAATTKISDSVFNAMLPWLKEGFGNASSLYREGRNSATTLNRARADCAAVLGCNPSEVFFTSGGTESDNWALRSVARMVREKGKDHIITSAFEHHAVLNPLRSLEKQGFKVTYLPVGSGGVIDPQDVSAALRDNTGLVTIMAVNNEIGTVQPISDVGRICHDHGVLFHTDAVQAMGNIHINVKDMHIDLLSVSGHKIHAMKGIGLLYAAKDINIIPFMEGGAQQGGKRAGTENIAGIVGLAQAMTDSEAITDIKNERLLPLREILISRLSEIPGSRLNGDERNRIAANVNFSFERIEGETLVLRADLYGVAVSSGSACASGSMEPSHVLTAIGATAQQAKGSIRITMSEETTREDIDTAAQVISDSVKVLRG